MRTERQTTLMWVVVVLVVAMFLVPGLSLVVRIAACVVFVAWLASLVARRLR
jgi:hypothetical protein